jgi:hypothetical protein
LRANEVVYRTKYARKAQLFDPFKQFGLGVDPGSRYVCPAGQRRDADQLTGFNESGERFGGSPQGAFVTLAGVLGEVMSVVSRRDPIVDPLTAT